jgi:CspA family cold shock protein
VPAGSVTSFDVARGVGTVTADGRDYFFHCTQIVDGSRSVAVGTPVRFRVVPGRRGDWEAAHLEKVDE